MEKFLRRTWAEIDEKALLHNFEIIKQTAKSKICAVVKANAYGHGVEIVAPALQKAGADFFAVSNIEEAVELRESGITKPILILGYTPCEYVCELEKYDISQCVYSLEYAKELSNEVASYNFKIKVHLKLDTGMSRIGFDCRSDSLNGIDDAITAANLDGFENLELTRKRTIAADESTFRTSLEGVFAVGDATNKGADIAISAIGEGKKAAEVIDTYLNGEIVGYKKPYVVERVVSPEEYEKYEKANRPHMPHLSPEERKHNFEEIVKGYSVEDAKKEASRCLECGCHDFYECKLIKYANEYDVKPARFGDNKHQRRNEQTHPYIERNPDKCILCGL